MLQIVIKFISAPNFVSHPWMFFCGNTVIWCKASPFWLQLWFWAFPHLDYVLSWHRFSWSQFLTDFHIWGTKSKLRTCSTRCTHAHCVYYSVKGQNWQQNCWRWQKLKTPFVKVYISWTFKWCHHRLIFVHNGSWWIEFPIDQHGQWNCPNFFSSIWPFRTLIQSYE